MAASVDEGHREREWFRPVIVIATAVLIKLGFSLWSGDLHLMQKIHNSSALAME